VEKIVATPHLFRENQDWQDFAPLEEKRRLLAGELRRNEIPVEVLPGAEVHIFHGLVEAVKKHRDNLVINHSSYMFVEFPAGHVYSGAKSLFFELMTEGITPIIAHPERNAVFMERPALLYELIQMGALAQANSGSLMGIYGREAGAAVVRLLRWNLVHFLASDAHNVKSIPPRLSGAVSSVEALIGKEQALCLVEGNPRAVLEDRVIPFLPSPVDPRKLRKSLNFGIPRFLKRK